MGDVADSAASEFIHVFNPTVTYKVTISDKFSPLILPECFTIQGKSDSSYLLLYFLLCVHKITLYTFKNHT